MLKGLNIRIKKGLLFLVFMVCFIAAANAKDVVRKYIAKYKPLVDSLSMEYGIPVSIITAISIVESGAGKSQPATLLNNHFGMVGRNTAMKRKGIKTKYKEYLNAAASFRDFCGMVSRKKYYRSLNGSNDYDKWVNAMAKAGYSTTPEVWKKEILYAIRKYKLDKVVE